MLDNHITDTRDGRGVRWATPQPFTHPDGTTAQVIHAEWERRGNGFPDRLWLTTVSGVQWVADPLGDLPDWLAATAPDWCDLVPAARKAVG